jgi:membrane-associated phospholipid phosphatase
MRIRAIAGLVALTLSGRAASAQTVGQILEDDFRNVGKDILSIWGAPFDGTGRDYLIAAGSLAIFGVSMIADQEVSDWAIENEDNAYFRFIKPLRRGGKLFTGKYAVPPIAALYIIGVATKNQDMRDFVLGCGAAWMGESPPRKLVAYAFGRARPDSIPNDPQVWELGGGYDNWMMRSFPGGHLANVMGCVSFWNNRFRMGAVEPLLWAFAASVGAGRLADEAHWFSDQLIGGILGYAVGKELAHRSLNREAERAARRSGTAGALGTLRSGTFYMTPDPLTGGMRLGLGWQF